MSVEICYTDMCRACMKTDGTLLSMYDDDDDINSMNLPDKLAELASIQISKFDGLPNKLCCKCAYRIQASYDFKQQVQETHKNLLKMFGKQHVLKKEEDEDHTDVSMQMNESFEFILPSDPSSDVSENLMTEVTEETNENKEEVMIDVSHLLRNYDDSKENTLSLDDVLSNLQETNEKQANAHSVKNKEEVTKFIGSEQYTIMYIPKSVIDTTTKISISDVNRIKQVDDDDDISIAVKVLNKQEEDTEETPHDVSTSGSAEFKVITEKEHALAMCQDNDSMEDKEASEKSNLNTEQLTLRTDNTDESDSDYFIDPKDNILGSLNDTITRIKELRQENVTVYQCTLCLQNYEELMGVLLHTIDNHVPSTGPFFCVVCEKDCESHRELRMHAKTHTGRLPYSCFVCNKAYATKRYLKRHMACHADLPRYRCPKCSVRFAAKADLETHVRTHVHGAPFACSQCSRQFNHKGNYKRHLISHLDPQGLHLPKYPCKVCDKRFPNNRTLETHMRVHTGEKPFSCEICGRSFSQQGNLLNHARIHSNPRSYTCDVCHKSFNQRATLKDHQLLHTGEKPHVCNVCGKAFTFSAALRRHMWSHANKKPFECETCDAQFVGKYDLRRHMQVHEDRQKVKRKRKFTTKSNDFLHMQVHTDRLKVKRNKKSKSDDLQEEFKEENSIVTEEPNAETVLIEQVLLPDDVTEVVHQVESEKENVDALFNFMQYGS